MSVDVYLGIAVAVFALLIVWHMYRNRCELLMVFIALFTTIGLMYFLWGYSILELVVTLSICLVACIGIVSALRLAAQDFETKSLIEFTSPKLHGLLSGLYRGVLSYTLLLVSSTAIAALLSIIVRNFFARLSIAVVLSIVIGYMLKRVGKLSIALIALTVLTLFACIVAPDSVVSDLRGFDEWFRLVEAVIGGVG